MNGATSPNLTSAGPGSRSRCALGRLSLLLLAASPLLFLAGFLLYGPTGIASAAVVLVICWTSGCLALACTAMAPAAQAAHAALFGMLFRTGLPLGAGLLVHFVGGPLRDAGFIPLLLGFYLVSLVVETWLSVRLLTAATAPKKAS